MKQINKRFRFVVLILIFPVIMFIFLSCKNTIGNSDISYDYKQNFKVVFTSRMNGSYDLYVLEIDNNKLTQLTNTEVSDYHPRFSPDSSKIVFVSFGENDEDEEIFSMDADGTDIIKVTDDEFNEHDPCYSADGNKIIYTSDRYAADINNPYPVSGIYVVNLDGSNETIIKDYDRTNNGYDPYISPDGKYLLFSSYWSYDDEIYLMDLQNMTATINLTNKEGWDGRPAFSPDGSKIVFSSARKSKTDCTDIYIMNSSGKNISRLTKNNSKNTDPCFSPDGKWIVFSSNRDGDSDIYMMNVNGKGLVNLTNNSADDYYPRFSPK